VLLWGLPRNARNGSCVTTIVGYRGNLVYRVVASIALWVTCGSLPQTNLKNSVA
jgi:hypothetical protein